MLRVAPLVPPLAVRLQSAALQKYPKSLLLHLAYPVINEETGKTLEYRQLKRHPCLVPIYNH